MRCPIVEPHPEEHASASSRVSRRMAKFTSPSLSPSFETLAGYRPRVPQDEVLMCLIRQRIGAQLEMDRQRSAALAAFLEPGRAIAACGPQPTALPAGIGIVDAAIESLGVEAQWIGQAQYDHLAVLESDDPVVEIAG